MIYVFLGYPGDGKTNALVSYCHKDDVDNDSKLIIYDDSFLIGQSVRIKEYCSLTDTEHIAKEIIEADYIQAKSNEGKTLYIDTYPEIPFSEYQESLKDIKPLQKIFVIDAVRLLYLSENDQLDLYSCDILVITKVDLLIETEHISSFIEEYSETMQVFITDGPMIPSSFKRMNKEIWSDYVKESA